MASKIVRTRIKVEPKRKTSIIEKLSPSKRQESSEVSLCSVHSDTLSVSQMIRHTELDERKLASNSTGDSTDEKLRNSPAQKSFVTRYPEANSKDKGCCFLKGSCRHVMLLYVMTLVSLTTLLFIILLILGMVGFSSGFCKCSTEGDYSSYGM